MLFERFINNSLKVESVQNGKNIIVYFQEVFGAKQPVFSMSRASRGVQAGCLDWSYGCPFESIRVYARGNGVGSSSSYSPKMSN